MNSTIIHFAVFAGLLFVCSTSLKAKNYKYILAKANTKNEVGRSATLEYARLKIGFTPDTSHRFITKEENFVDIKASGTGDATVKRNTYYLSKWGNDKHEGNKANPWKTIRKLNGILLKPGDSVCFKGGQTFFGYYYS